MTQHKTRTKWILVEADADLDCLNGRQELVGFDFHAFELVKDNVLNRLREVTLEKQFELGAFLRSECPSAIEAYIQAMSNIGQQSADPFWQAHEVAAKTGQGQLPIVCALAASIDKVPVKNGMILANLTPASIAVLSPAIRDAGHTVEIIVSTFKFRNTKVFKALKFTKTYFKNTFQWTRRVLSLRRYGLIKTKVLPVGALVIRSYYFKNSTVSGQFKDIYFEPLIIELKKKKIEHYHWCSFYDFDGSMLPELKQLVASGKIVFLENYLKISEIFSTGILGTFSTFRTLCWLRKNPIYVGSVNVTSVVVEDLLVEWSNGQSFAPILNYIAATKFSKSNPKAKILYPLENLTWERMMIAGLKKGSGFVSTIGHQHSLLVPSQMYVQLAKDEYLHLPLPDKIIATGPKAVDALQKAMHLPDHRILSGCALRGFLPATNKLSEWSKNLNVLVALNTVPDAVGLIRFLNDANSCEAPLDSSIQIKLRFHPLFSCGVVSQFVDVPSSGPFVENACTSLTEALHWSTVVIYSGSTVGLEAMFRFGKPVVYVDLDSLILRDPLSHMTKLKHTVRKPDDLMGAIGIAVGYYSGFGDDDRQVGIGQAMEYFSPPDSAGLNRFLGHIH